MAKRKVFASRLRRPYRTERSGLLLGSMAWCRALGTSCLPGQSRSGTPRGELPPPYPSPASGGGSGWGQPRARKARVKLRVSRRSASPFVCGLGGHREKPRNGARGKALKKWWDEKLAREQKSRRETGSALSFRPRDSGGGGPREAWWRGRLTRRFVVVERIFDEARAPPPRCGAARSPSATCVGADEDEPRRNNGNVRRAAPSRLSDPSATARRSAAWRLSARCAGFAARARRPAGRRRRAPTDTAGRRRRPSRPCTAP